MWNINFDMKFPSWDKFKPSVPNEDKVFPSWNELNNKIKKFEYKVDEKVKKLDENDTALESAAEECFLVLPPPFDSLAEKIYDSSPGPAREKIKQAVAYFRQLQSGGATKYNHILTNLEEVISVKDTEELQSRENLQKIYGILIGKIDRERKSTHTLTEPSHKEKMNCETAQVQPSETNLKISQEEQNDPTKYKDNKSYIVKILSKAGLPLVLRSEQSMTIQDELKNEITSFLKENTRLAEKILQSNTQLVDDDEYLLRTGNFHYLLGNLEKSIELYDQVLKRHPNKMTALNNKGVVLDSSGRYDTAVDCYSKALNSVPENVHVLCNKGISLYKNGKYDEGLACFDLALKFDANYVNALTFKGHTFYRLRKNDDALSCYNKVIRLEQNNAEALYNKACLCSLKGDEYGALTSLERAIRLDPLWRLPAIKDSDLDRVRNNPRFSELVQSSN
jgi:tetratricopeptide (TPR) repeat protein